MGGHSIGGRDGDSVLARDLCFNKVFRKVGRREEYKPEAIKWEDIAPEAETGKQFLLPDQASGGVAVDQANRPVLVLRPRWALHICHARARTHHLLPKSEDMEVQQAGSRRCGD